MKNKKRKTKRIVPLWVIAICLLSACSSRPSSVLSEKKMEAVMYDMLLAESEIDGNYSEYGTDSLRKQTLLNVILDKHKVKETQFDTSLVWYTANLDKLEKIYKNLGERYNRELDTLLAVRSRSLEKEEPMDILDGTDLWAGEKVVTLASAANLRNVFTFRIDTASLFKGDNYALRFDALGVTDSINPTVMFCVQCDDTTFFSKETLSRNGQYRSVINPLNKLPRAIYGSVVIPADKRGVNITLIRFSILQQRPPKLRNMVDESVRTIELVN